MKTGFRTVKPRDSILRHIGSHTVAPIISPPTSPRVPNNNLILRNAEYPFRCTASASAIYLQLRHRLVSFHCVPTSSPSCATLLRANTSSTTILPRFPCSITLAIDTAYHTLTTPHNGRPLLAVLASSPLPDRSSSPRRSRHSILRDQKTTTTRFSIQRAHQSPQLPQLHALQQTAYRNQY